MFNWDSTFTSIKITNCLILHVLLCQISLAQKVVTRINTPATIAGTKIFASSDFGADLSSGLWTADAVRADPFLACQKLKNPASLSGKMALIENGGCFLEEKCLKAQEAGAIAVVILNHGELSNQGGPPYKISARSRITAGKLTIPCVMLGYEENLNITEAISRGETINITIGSEALQENDMAIYTKVLPGFNESYVMNPKLGCIPYWELKESEDYIFQPGAIVINESPSKVENVNLSISIQRNKSIEYRNTTDQYIIIESDSTSKLLNEPYILKATIFGRRDITYNVSNDKADPFQFDNEFKTFYNISDGVISKCRFDLDRNAPIATQYLGGDKDYRDIIFPFRLKRAKWAFIDSLFANVASDEPLKGMYFEGKIFKFTDLNVDGNITNDELELIAIGAYTFPSSATGFYGTVRIGLEDLIGDPKDPYFIDQDTITLLASIHYPGGLNSFFMGYDAAFSQRLNFYRKDSLKRLDITDWPYIFARKQDVITGWPDIEQAGLFYLDANGDGVTQTEEIVFFPPSMAINIIYPPEASYREINHHQYQDITISPLPAVDHLNIGFHLDNAGKVRYRIYHTNGELIFQQEDISLDKEITKQINITQLPAGNYSIQIHTEDGLIKKAFQKVNR
mgnify:CR=1 FL=1